MLILCITTSTQPRHVEPVTCLACSGDGTSDCNMQPQSDLDAGRVVSCIGRCATYTKLYTESKKHQNGRTAGE